MIFDSAIGVGRRVGITILESALVGAFKAHYRSQSGNCDSSQYLWRTHGR